MFKLHYKTISGKKITDSLIADVKRLFDTSYGVWSKTFPPTLDLAGKQIKFPLKNYIEYFRGSSEYDGECDMALCYDGDKLVGEAIYVNKHTSRGNVAIVVQLVVDENYRRHGIGSTLLYSIWGFSDYYAWGVVTSNPCTVKALEKATSRYCSVDEIIQNKNFLKNEVLSHIRFLDKTRERWVINRSSQTSESRIRTGFATARLERGETLAEVESRLGRIGPQDEWLAFVFNSQKIVSDVGFRQMLDQSNLIVHDAYMRMNADNHAWASRTSSEVDEILKIVLLEKDAAICDFGAGSGRHLMELKRRGYKDVVGIDFATDEECEFVRNGDCRFWKGEKPFDLILCLYDVIGSFQKLEDNQAILENVFANLKRGGKAVISVMNLDFKGMSSALSVGNDPDELCRSLRELKPSAIMANTGEVFDGGYALVNHEDGLVYRKEQFDGDDKRLRRELVIVDRRFTRKSIVDLCRAVGFEVLGSRYVRAGFKPPSFLQRLQASRWGKEILLVLSKP